MLPGRYINTISRNWSLIVQSRQDFNRERMGMNYDTMKILRLFRLNFRSRQVKMLPMDIQMALLTQSSCPVMASHRIHLSRTHQGRHYRCTLAPVVRHTITTAS